MSTATTRPQALVTGGTRGIGRAVCLQLARDGFDVAFTFRSDPAQAEALELELKTLGAGCASFRVDLSDAEALKNKLAEITERFPAIEVLVSNAGVSIDGLAARFKAEDWDTTMNTNTRAAFMATQAVMRSMMKARNGSVIYISSVIGQMGNAGQAAYSASKGALNAMAKSLAKELGSRGIRVNAIAPGFIKTDMTERLPDATKQSILSQIPLGEFGSVEDVAELVSFLASPRSRYITGQTIGLNGGLYM